MAKSVSGKSEYPHNNSAYFVDIPEIEKKDGDLPVASLAKEMKEYIYAVQEKAKLAKNHQKHDLVPILENVAADMNRIIGYYESGGLSFHKSYEDIVSLYVFVEIYFKIPCPN